MRTEICRECQGFQPLYMSHRSLLTHNSLIVIFRFSSLVCMKCFVFLPALSVKMSSPSVLCRQTFASMFASPHLISRRLHHPCHSRRGQQEIPPLSTALPPPPLLSCLPATAVRGLPRFNCNGHTSRPCHRGHVRRAWKIWRTTMFATPYLRTTSSSSSRTLVVQSESNHHSGPPEWTEAYCRR
jgi:hypothetical protein